MTSTLSAHEVVEREYEKMKRAIAAAVFHYAVSIYTDGPEEAEEIAETLSGEFADRVASFPT
jgi:hypothetical protein